MKRKEIIIAVVILSALAIFATEIFREIAEANDELLDKQNCDKLHEAEKNGTDLSEYSDVPELRLKCAKLA